MAKPLGVVNAELRQELARVRAENARLRKELDEAQLSDIAARNPGIDMDEVRRFRAAIRRVADGPTRGEEADRAMEALFALVDGTTEATR